MRFEKVSVAGDGSNYPSNCAKQPSRSGKQAEQKESKSRTKEWEARERERATDVAAMKAN